MLIHDIKKFPTTIGFGPNGNRYHESIFRSYQTLEKVKEYLEQGAPPKVVLEVIRDIEDTRGIDKEI